MLLRNLIFLIRSGILEIIYYKKYSHFLQHLLPTQIKYPGKLSCSLLRMMLEILKVSVTVTIIIFSNLKSWLYLILFSEISRVLNLVLRTPDYISFSNSPIWSCTGTCCPSWCGFLQLLSFVIQLKCNLFHEMAADKAKWMQKLWGVELGSNSQVLKIFY